MRRTLREVTSAKILHDSCSLCLSRFPTSLSASATQGCHHQGRTERLGLFYGQLVAAEVAASGNVRHFRETGLLTPQNQNKAWGELLCLSQSVSS